MSKKSNNTGRAYEYIYLMALKKEISQIRACEIDVTDSGFYSAKKASETITDKEKEIFQISAESSFAILFAMEPIILEKDSHKIFLKLQKDKKGEEGDVRDLLIKKERDDKNKKWEIGLSLKHNNDAVKHSRIAKDLDFGEKWYGIKCSDNYWKNVNKIFEYLEDKKNLGLLFNKLPDKEDKIYVPLLNAFMAEIRYQISNHPDIPKKLVEYLLSRYDFYKIISFDSKKITLIETFNLFGTLNHASKDAKPSIKVPLINLPKHLLFLDFKPKSKTTIIMTFDNGWQFSFRIHNGDKKVNTSLKFDIRIIGMPSDLCLKKICKW